MLFSVIIGRVKTMPHSRPRHVLNVFLKRLKFSRVISIQGARQVGKSFFVREMIKPHLPQSEYVTLDKRQAREFAESNPDSFLDSFEGTPLLLDEAQKAPVLFDTVKWKVDENPKPGQFVLLGSTEFSKELNIKESLTGRLSRVRLFSMNLAESQQMPQLKKPFSLLNQKPRATRKELLRHLKKGGFPGIFSIHDSKIFHEALGDWIRLTVERDMLQFPKIKVNPDLVMKIFEQLASVPEPNNASIAKATRCSARTSQKILDLLVILFAVHKLNPHRLGTGKPLYFFSDVSLASFFGAPFERVLWTWALHEQLSQRSYLGDHDTKINFYRNTKGSMIHLVLENDAQLVPIKILPTEKWDKRDYEILKAFEHKATLEKKKIVLTALGSTHLRMKNPKVEVFPYEALA